MSDSRYRALRGVAAAAVAMLLWSGVIGAQTVITAPANRYSAAEDVQIGRQAAEQVARQLPILDDRNVTSPIASVGRRLVDAIPPEFRHGEFRYSFDVINVREVNAFALPGGPMYINRGMIQAARNEGEMASVMAHELSHVALRHGSAQATKATKYEIGALAGAVIGGHHVLAMSRGSCRRPRSRAIPKCSFTFATICGSVSVSVVSMPTMRSHSPLERPMRSLSCSLASPGPKIRRASGRASRRTTSS